MVWEFYKQDPLMEMIKVKQELDFYNFLSFLIEQKFYIDQQLFLEIYLYQF